MAVTHQASTQAAIEKAGGTGRLTPTETGGVLFAYFRHVQDGAGDATSTVRLRRLPGGPVRVIGHLSRINHSAFGASRVLDVGHAAHAKPDGSSVAASANAFADDINVASGGSAALSGYVRLESDAGIDVIATVAGGTIPDGATIEGVIAFMLG